MDFYQSKVQSMNKKYESVKQDLIHLCQHKPMHYFTTYSIESNKKREHFGHVFLKLHNQSFYYYIHMLS